MVVLFSPLSNMYEKMNSSKELQQLNNQLDKLKRKLAGALERKDDAIAAVTRNEIAAQQKKINSLKSLREKKVYKETIALKEMAFSRPLSKKEQADLGTLKRIVKGIVVVHPLTALGRELGITVVTGFAKREF